MDERTSPSSVLVVDDHRSFAEMLAAALDGTAGLCCVGTATTAAEGVAMAARLQPDIVVMDIEMPREDGLLATSRIRQVAPTAVVAVVTAYTSPEWVGRAAQAGASAFIPKSGSFEELISVLTRAQSGQMVVAPSTYLASPQPLDARPTELSPRELDVLRRLAQGTPVKELAPALGITVGTCQSYVKSLRRKLGATNQLDAVLKAREQGLLDRDL